MSKDIFKPDVSFLQSPDILKFEGNEKKNTEYTTIKMEVVRPNDDENDFIIQVRASLLKRIRDKLSPLCKQKFPLTEILLGVSTTLIGVVLSSIAADIKIEETKGIIIFVVLPVIAAICGTSYFFVRANNVVLISKFAQELLKEIPNPDATTQKQKK